MPIGPSHRRSSGGSSGSSRGSHSFGGGGSFGGSFGSHGHHSPRHRVPIRINLFGSRVVVSSKRQSLFIFVASLLIFAIFGAVMLANIKNAVSSTVSNYKSEIAQIELDAVWYADAKDKALAGDDERFFVAYADYVGVQRVYYNAYNPTGYYFDEDDDVRLNNIPYFYLIYRYEVPEDTDNDGVFDSTKWLEGETYSEFSSSQAAGWDKKIIVGYDNGSWASINYDYSLENNEEYQFLKQRLKSNEESLSGVTKVFVILIFVIVGLAALVVVCIVFIVKKGKADYKNEQEKIKSEIEKQKAEAELAKDKASQINRHCVYCGGSVPDGANKCPSCGSTKFK